MARFILVVLCAMSFATFTGCKSSTAKEQPSAETKAPEATAEEAAPAAEEEAPAPADEGADETESME
jgi:hypothetical protein